MAKNRSGLPGYPSAAQLQAEALALARSAVPTRRSITRQYGRQIQSTQGFTEALAHLLGQSNPGAGYDTALTQQQGIDSAAQARLAALGGQYGAGSAAAVGGIGDSAMSSLVARGAAAKAYAGQLPQVAAARGQLFRSGLVKDENAALQQRGEDLRQSYAQAIQQVQQNALARSVAAANITNQRGQLALAQASLGERAREFNSSQAQQFAEFQANLQQQIQSAKQGTGGDGPGGALSGFTPGQIATFQKDAAASVTSSIHGGATIQQTIRSLITGGTPRPIALFEAQRIYQDAVASKPQPGQFADAARYRRVLANWQAVAKSYNKWVAKRYWRQYKGAPSSNQPVSFQGGPH